MTNRAEYGSEQCRDACALRTTRKSFAQDALKATGSGSGSGTRVGQGSIDSDSTDYAFQFCKRKRNNCQVRHQQNSTNFAEWFQDTRPTLEHAFFLRIMGINCTVGRNPQKKKRKTHREKEGPFHISVDRTRSLFGSKESLLSIESSRQETRKRASFLNKAIDSYYKDTAKACFEKEEKKRICTSLEDEIKELDKLTTFDGLDFAFDRADPLEYQPRHTDVPKHQVRFKLLPKRQSLYELVSDVMSERRHLDANTDDLKENTKPNQSKGGVGPRKKVVTTANSTKQQSNLKNVPAEKSVAQNSTTKQQANLKNVPAEKSVTQNSSTKQQANLKNAPAVQMATQTNSTKQRVNPENASAVQMATQTNSTKQQANLKRPVPMMTKMQKKGLLQLPVLVSRSQEDNTRKGLDNISTSSSDSFDSCPEMTDNCFQRLYRQYYSDYNQNADIDNRTEYPMFSRQQVLELQLVEERSELHGSLKNQIDMINEEIYSLRTENAALKSVLKATTNRKHLTNHDIIDQVPETNKFSPSRHAPAPFRLLVYYFLAHLLGILIGQLCS